MKRWQFALAGGLVFLATTSLLAREKVEADPNQDYPVNPQAGAWMIMAASFTGPDAKELARQTVYILRSRDHLPAYYHDYSAALRKQRDKEKEYRAKLLPDVPVRTYHVTEQIGVLIGGYKTIDDAHDSLAAVKELKIPDLKLPGGKLPFDYVQVVEPSEKKKNVGEVKRMAVNPFTNSFTTRNPTVAHDETQKFDPSWTKLNADEKYNLLDCKKSYTLVVKEYHGDCAIAPAKASSSFLEKLGFGKSTSSGQLTAAALNAHNLAEGLRKMKYEAYVFHTRGNSYVTVGSFDSLKDPKLAKMQQAFAKDIQIQIKDPKFNYLQLAANPLPMEIPRPDK